MPPAAKVILDSVSKDGNRLTTLEVKFHRFVLAEFNTHRAFSRNSASSRAIPYAKYRDAVIKDPAFPVSWPSAKPGMSGGDELDRWRLEDAQIEWETALADAVATADRINSLGLHKSVTNRLLEPFAWHTCIVTATDWDNFFTLRCSPEAQPEIRAVAEQMRDAISESTPIARDNHRPYVHNEDVWGVAEDYKDMISAARCARVSYLTHNGVRDISKDVELFNKLVRSGHWSPLEHVAVADTGRHANFTGWRQLRMWYN